MPIPPKPTKWVSTNSPIWPKKNSKAPSWCPLKNKLTQLKKPSSKSEMLTGLPLVPSKSSKIKEDVDHAGLSPESPSPNPSNSWALEPSDFSPINKLTLVTHSLPDVTEDGIIGPYNTWPPLESVPKLLTLIPPEPPDKLEPVEILLAPKTLTPSTDIPPSLDYLDLWANLTLPQ